MRDPRTGKATTRGKWQEAWKVLVTSSVAVTLVLVVFLSGQTYVPSQIPLLPIRRSIQSWPRNGVLEPINITADIEAAVSEQRALVFDEMRNFKYPNGRFNVTAKSLRELVPESGGRPLRSVVVTTWRSGSTFLGDILNALPGNYYHYEPLLDFGVVQVRGPPLANEALSNLRNLLNCNYSSLDKYLTHGQNHNWLFTHNTRLWERCQAHPRICWTPAFLNRICSLFPFQSMKLVRLRLALVEPLLTDPELGVRVLLLVRDPRGTLQSRTHREWCPNMPDCDDPARLCSDLLSDYTAAKSFASLYPGRFMVMRYEEMAVAPYKQAAKILEFFGLPYTKSVKRFLDSHTKSDAGGVSSTYRNSKKAPFHWRWEVRHSRVVEEQKSCKEAMLVWGYAPAKDPKHQRTFNPVLPFKLNG